MALSDLIFIDGAGFHYPDYPTILTSVTNEFKSIYGIDAYVDPDSQDGQNIAIRALAIYDTLQVLSIGLTQFSPSFAIGQLLSSTVKTNGITRKIATNSTVDVTIVGTANTIITSGKAEDINGNKWLLPATVTIPISGTITVTATSETAGAITASSSTITKIATPVAGWQTVNNASTATVGLNGETDAELRIRQRVSTAMPSLSILDGLRGAIANITGVLESVVLENNTASTDANGIPAHAIACVINGGDSTVLAQTISLRKTPGISTYGTTNISFIDSHGVTQLINFFRPTVANIKVIILANQLTGYKTSTPDLIKASILASINSLLIGEDVFLSKLYLPANLNGGAESGTYDITSITIARDAGAFGASNIVLAFNELAQTILSDITVTIV